MLRNLVLMALAAPWACLACDPRVCRDAGPETHALPGRLSETGLFDDIQTERLAARVYAYTPAFALWSDGAEKRRFIFVPDGERVDTTDFDDWRFPEGTKLWKEFSRDGVRVETRLLQKLGPADSDWSAVAYLWRPDHSDAERVPYGAINALGTPHDVPAAGECSACHDGRRSRALGFSAIQLALAGTDGEQGLSEAVQSELLSQNLPRTLELPGAPRERAALGYLHANCSHCHNQSGAGADVDKCLDPAGSVDLDFSLRTDELSSTADTATYRTAIGTVVKPGHPDDSKLLDLVSKRGAFRQMPPIGTERVDSSAVHALRDWIGHL